MKIPDFFYLYGQKIKVEFNNTLSENKGAIGEWDDERNLIRLQIKTDVMPLSTDVVENTLVHEALHACLDLMDEGQLSQNEKFVTQLGNLLHQFIKQIES